MTTTKIPWEVNFARIGPIRIERSNAPDGWYYMLSTEDVTYLKVDNRRFKTKEELDEAILEHVSRIRSM